MKNLATVILACLPSFASAATVVTGTDTFDPMTGLYTYSYTIDNIAGPSSPITTFGVKINNAAGTVSEPISTSPMGWGFSVAASSCCALLGTFFQWSYLLVPQVGIPPGSILSGFSFSVPYAPSNSLSDNYFLFSIDDSLQFGNTVALTVPFPTPLSDSPTRGPAAIRSRASWPRLAGAKASAGLTPQWRL
jgi:hypothetical protein